METKRWYLAVPFGDPAGIGPEIVLKAMQRVNLPPSMGMVVIGEMPLLKKVSTDLGIPSDFDAVAVDEGSLVRAIESGSRYILYSQNILDMHRFNYGEIQAMCGQAAYHAVEQAVRLIRSGYADAW